MVLTVYGWFWDLDWLVLQKGVTVRLPVEGRWDFGFIRSANTDNVLLFLILYSFPSMYSAIIFFPYFKLASISVFRALIAFVLLQFDQS